MKRIKRIRWLLLGIVVAALILVIAWPRPKLVWCTLPTVSVGKQHVRIALLIPRSWMLASWTSRSEFNYDIVEIKSIDRGTWLSDSVRHLLHLEDGPRGYINVVVCWPASSPVLDVAPRLLRHNGYVCANQAVFNSTWKQILNSVKVEEVRK